MSHFCYLCHRRPLSAHSQPVAGVLPVAAGDGDDVGVGVVGAEEGGANLELAVRGVGVLSGQQARFTQPLIQLRSSSLATSRGRN